MGIFIICKHFSMLFLIIFEANVVFNNIFYINTVLFNADINFTNGYGWGSNYKLEVFIPVLHLKILSHWIIFFRSYLNITFLLRKHILRVLSLIKLFFSIFVIFLCFCKAWKDSVDFDLKSCSKFKFYTPEKIKLQENLNNVNRTTNIFKHFLGLNPGPCQMQFNDDKIWETLETRGFHFWHLNLVYYYYLKLTNLKISQVI